MPALREAVGDESLMELGGRCARDYAWRMHACVWVGGWVGGWVGEGVDGCDVSGAAS
jgi:hypothetical protein